jgi:hypothetical protein
MDVRPLDLDGVIAEACCDNDLTKRPPATEEERTWLRAAEIKAEWLRKMMPRGLSAQIAYEGEEAVGFIEYMPIELSIFHVGMDLYVVNCLVAPHTAPWGEATHERIPGCGSALVRAMIEDVRDRCKGIVTPLGFAYTEDMSGFFSGLGFEQFENQGLKMLIKGFEAVELPLPVPRKRRRPSPRVPGKVVVDVLWCSKCPASPYTLLNVRDVCGELGDRVVLNEFRIDDREAQAKYGAPSGAFVNGEYPWSTYGPLDKKEIRDVLGKALEHGEAAPG